MEEQIGAGSWQTKLLREGHKPEWIQEPGRYREKNNKSAVNNIEFVRKKVAEWEAGGFVERVKEQPWCTSPLSVSDKKDQDTGKTKQRICLDLSRHVNKHVREQKVKYQDLRATEKLRHQGDYMSVFDLENQYFHVYLHEEVRKYFGFAVEEDDGSETFYQAKVMIYGYAPAGAVVTRLIKPLQGYLHDKGIRTTIYVDDGQVLGKTKEEAERHTAETLETFQKAGWNIQWKKTSTEPTQTVKYLGFQIDSEKMTYSASEGKQREFCDMAGQLVEKARKGQPVKCREVAAVVGKAISAMPAYGKVLQTAMRNTQNEMGRAVITSGWEAEIRLGPREQAEVEWARANCVHFNGRGIQSGDVEELVMDRQTVKFLVDKADRGEGTQASLAEGEKSWILRVDGQLEQIEEYPGGVGQNNVVGGLAELGVLCDVLLDMPKQEGRWKVLRWHTASRNCYNFIKKGARCSAVAEEVVRLRWAELRARVEVVPVWQADTWEDIVAADKWSEGSASTDEWGVEEQELEKVFEELGCHPTIDAFANRRNTKCERFYSKHPQMGAEGVDFFSQTLSSEEVYYCCPPVKDVAAAICKLNGTKGVTAIMVMPAWKSSPYWSLLRDRDGFKPAVKKWKFWETGEFRNTGPGNVLFARGARIQMWAAVYKTGIIKSRNKGR